MNAVAISNDAPRWSLSAEEIDALGAELEAIWRVCGTGLGVEAAC